MAFYHQHIGLSGENCPKNIQFDESPSFEILITMNHYESHRERERESEKTPGNVIIYG